MWMPKLQRLGMQMHEVGCLSIKWIAYDGTIQSIGMGCMYSQLMCATGFWVEGYSGMGICTAEDFVTGHGRFAPFVVYYLQRTVVKVGAEG